MKSFIGLSVIVFTNGVFAESLPVDRDMISEEWDQLGQLNALRAAGFTCPDGTVFPPNDVSLVWDCGLWKAGQLHSQDMADQDYFSHYSLDDNKSPWTRASEQGTSANGENIAAGSMDPLGQWKSSNGHCLNMMKASHKSVGVGYGYNTAASYNRYWTQMLSGSLPPSGKTDCYMDPTPKPTPEPTMAPIPTPEPTAPIPTPEPTKRPTNADGSMMHAEEMEFFRLANEARINGITCNDGNVKVPMPAFEWNCGLWRAANGHSMDMATNNFWSRTGSDGSSHSDRAQREGADFGCSGFMIGGSSNAADAYARFEGLTCNYFLMESRYNSFGVGFGYDPDSSYKYYWTIMLGDAAPTEELKNCYDDATPEPTNAPTSAPTNAPTALPTGSPTIEPTSEPTDAPVTASCSDFDQKSECKANSECAWKKSCKAKATICPKQKNQKKCDKFNCTWSDDDGCSWAVQRRRIVGASQRRRIVGEALVQEAVGEALVQG